MVLGPVFQREAVTTPRRPKHYLYRSLYVAALLLLMGTAWLVLAGTQSIRNVGDMSRFGAMIFQILAPLQMALAMFLAALGSASSVSLEKDRRTLILLLLTRMSNSQLVLGKLAASLLNVLAMVLAALPVFMLVTLFGGVATEQVVRVYAVTILSVIAAGSVGCTIALWREKTFQALAMTALVMVLWISVWEGLRLVAGSQSITWLANLAGMISPLQAIVSACQPDLSSTSWWASPTVGFLVSSTLIVIVLNGVSIWRVRIWNPSREVRPGQQEQESAASIWGAEHDLTHTESPGLQQRAEAARDQHVDARKERTAGQARNVWDNPVLWREVCTWAYGRKVILIRVVYVLLALLTLAGVHYSLAQAQYVSSSGAIGDIIPATAQPLAPFFLLSLVIVNALAVTSITNERDGQAIDLLLVTDISPREFVFGKLWGVLWVTREMVAAPLLIMLYLWFQGGINNENLLFVVGVLIVMNAFVTVLGIHYGMSYSSSRTAILMSLGTVFFLFIGVMTCIAVMVSFSGSFQNQLPPFLAFILGGGIGLYAALGHRNPSPAIAAASLLLPFLTFFSITSFLLRNQEMTVFVVTCSAYGFTTAALLIPAIYEFDFAMGRTKGPEDE